MPAPQANIIRIEINPADWSWAPVEHIKTFCAEHQNDVWKGLLLWIKYGEIACSTSKNIGIGAAISVL